MFTLSYKQIYSWLHTFLHFTISANWMVSIIAIMWVVCHWKHEYTHVIHAYSCPHTGLHTCYTHMFCTNIYTHVYKLLITCLLIIDHMLSCMFTHLFTLMLTHMIKLKFRHVYTDV